MKPSTGGANTCENCGRATSTQYDLCFRCRRNNSLNAYTSSESEPADSVESRSGVRLTLFVVGLLGLSGAIVGPYGFSQRLLVYLIPVLLLVPYGLDYYNLL
jgi:hypothetical protein